jgi:hypothetical protein
VGIAGRLRPRRLAEEAQLTPHGKRATWSGNQLITFLNSNKVYENTLIKKENSCIVQYLLNSLIQNGIH